MIKSLIFPCPHQSNIKATTIKGDRFSTKMFVECGIVIHIFFSAFRITKDMSTKG